MSDARIEIIAELRSENRRLAARLAEAERCLGDIENWVDRWQRQRRDNLITSSHALAEVNKILEQWRYLGTGTARVVEITTE